MFESSRRSSGGNSANRWLLVAGAGLVILAFVARMLLDIGHTKVSDLAGVLRPDTAAAAAPAAPPVDSVAPVVDTPLTMPPDTTARVVVASPPPVLKTDTTTAAVAPARGTGYVIQIGAFGSEANAQKLVQRAAALGYRAGVVPQVRGASTLYVVRVNGTGSAADAGQASDSLAHSLGVKAVVLRPGR